MRLVDADAWREELCKKLDTQYIASQRGQFDDGTGERLADYIMELDSRPTVDAVPVVHACWEDCPVGWKRCSCCKTIAPGEREPELTSYCSYCGAKMYKEIDHEND